MTNGYTGDCYICTVENFDTICDTLINKGCSIRNVVPTEYHNNGITISATKLCITYERPNKPISKSIEKDLNELI